MMDKECKTCFWLKCQCDDCTAYSRWRPKDGCIKTDTIVCHKCGKAETVNTKPWPNTLGYIRLLPVGWVSGIVDLNDCWCPQCNPRTTPAPALREARIHKAADAAGIYILDNLAGRGGFCHVWGQTDIQVRTEILTAITAIIERELKAALSGEKERE